MTDNLQQEAREAANRLLMEEAPIWKFLFSPGEDIFNLVATAYILGHTARDKEIEKLHTRVNELEGEVSS